MAFNADFDTPQSASGRYINVAGTVPPNTTFVEVMQVSVLRLDSTTDYFYLTKEYTNTTSSDSAVSETLIIAIVPAVTGTEAVTFTSFGSLVGQVDLQ